MTFICSICHNSVFPLFMTYHRVCNKSNTTGATCGAGTDYPCGAVEFTPCFYWLRVTRSLVFCICFIYHCLSFCPFFLWSLSCLYFGHCLVCTLVIVLSVLRLMISDYPFSIFKLFSIQVQYKNDSMQTNVHVNFNLLSIKCLFDLLIIILQRLLRGSSQITFHSNLSV